MAATPSVKSGRVLQNLTPHDLNTLNRLEQQSSQKQKHDNSRQLIKVMSSQKRKIKQSSPIWNQDTNLVRRVDSCRYVVDFPPGAMGLHLEPVITSYNPDRKIGCRVKAFHFDSHYRGINKDLIQDVVSIGDVLYIVDGIDVYLSPFDDVFQMLCSRQNQRKSVGFKVINVDSNRHIRDNISCVRSEPTSCGSSTPPSNTAGVHISTPRPTPRAPPVISPDRRDACEFTILQSQSPPQPRTPTNLSFLASVDDLSLLHVDTLRSLFPVRFEELTDILADLGANIGSSLLTAGAVMEDKTGKVLEQTAHRIPLYSRDDVDRVNGKVKVLLRELSETCMRLGESDYLMNEASRELAEIKVSETREYEKARKLESEVMSLSARLEEVGAELGAEQGDRDAWMARANAAEEDAQYCREEFQMLQSRYDQLLEEFQMYHQQTEKTYQDAMCTQDREEGTFQQELEQMRQQYDNLRDEMEDVVRNMREKTSKIERERDVALTELEVMRDIAGTEKQSIDSEKSRVKEALNTQQKLHMQRIVESEEECHRIRSEYAELKTKHDKMAVQFSQAQSMNAVLESKVRAAEERKEELQSCLNRSEREVQKLRGDVKAAYTESRERKSDCEQLRDVVTELEAKLDAASRADLHSRAEAESREQQVAKLRGDLQESQRDVISKESEIAEAKTFVTELRQELESVKKHSADQMARLRSRFETRESELLGTVLGSEKHLAQMQANYEEQLSKLEADFNAARSSKDLVESELSRTKEKLQDSTRSLEEITSRYEELSTDSKQTKVLLGAEKKQKEEIEAKYFASENICDNLRSEIDEIRADSNEAKTSLEKMRALAFDANAKFNLQCVELDSLKTQLQQASAAIIKLQTTLDVRDREVGKLQNDLERCRSILAVGLPQLKSNIAAIASDVKFSLLETRDNFHLQLSKCLQIVQNHQCRKCTALTSELSDARDLIAYTELQLELQSKSSASSIKAAQDRVDEFNARYNAASVEASILREQLEKIVYLDKNEQVCVQNHTGESESISSCNAALSIPHATDTIHASQSSFLGGWGTKYGRELQAISSMHASIANMESRNYDSMKSTETIHCAESTEGDTKHEAHELPSSPLFDEAEVLQGDISHELNVGSGHLQQQLRSAENTITSLKNEIQALNISLGTCRCESKELLSDIEADRDRCINELALLKRELSNTSSQVIELQQRYDHDINTSKSRLADAEVRIQELTVINKENIRSSEDGRHHLESELQEVCMQLKAKDSALSVLKERYESDLYDLKSEYECLRKRCTESEDKLLTNAERTAKMLSELTEERDGLRLSLKESDEKAEFLYCERISRLQSELEISESAVSTLGQTFEEEINKLRMKCTVLQEAADNSEKEMLDAFKSIAISELKYNQAVQQCNELTEEKMCLVEELTKMRESCLLDNAEGGASSSSTVNESATSTQANRDPMMSSLLNQLQSVIAEAQSREKEWGETRTSLTDMIRDWRDRASEAKTQSLILEKEIVELTNIKTQVEKENEFLNTILTGKDKEISKLQEIVRTLADEAVRSTSDVAINDETQTSFMRILQRFAVEEDVVVYDANESQQVISSGVSSVRESRESISSQVSVLSHNSSNLEGCGNEHLSTSLIQQVRSSNGKIKELSTLLLESQAREELLKIQIAELEVDEFEKGYSAVNIPDPGWKAVVKFLLGAWRASREKVAAANLHGISQIEAKSTGYFSAEEMEYIHSIANETLSQDLCSDVIRSVNIEAGAEETGKPQGSSPILSPLRGGEDENESSSLWYVSSCDEDQLESSSYISASSATSNLQAL